MLSIWKKTEKNERLSLLLLAGCVLVLAALLWVRF